MPRVTSAAAIGSIVPALRKGREERGTLYYLAIPTELRGSLACQQRDSGGY